MIKNGTCVIALSHSGGLYPYHYTPEKYNFPSIWEPYPDSDDTTNWNITTWISCPGCMGLVELGHKYCPHCGHQIIPEPEDDLVQKMDEILDELKKFNEFQELIKKLDSGEALKHMEEIFKKYEELVKND